MIEDLNRRAFAALQLHLDLGSGALLGAHALAQWLIFLVPAALALLWIFGGPQDRRADVAAIMTATLALLLAHLASGLVAHPRPFLVEPVRNYLNVPPDSSFPSDQATLFFALAFSFAVRRAPSCSWLGPLFLACALAVGWARILLGAHYPLDIAGSALIALAAGPITQSRRGTSAFDRMTAAAERVYGFVLPSHHRSF